MALKNVSASQLSTFGRCKRKWHWEKIGGFRGDSTASQRRGTAIHHALELYLKTGEIVGGVEMDIASGNATGLVCANKPKEPSREDKTKKEGREWWGTKRFVLAAQKYLPKPQCQGGPEVLLEERMSLPTLDGEGPPWLGFIDLLIEEFTHKALDINEPIPCVTDYKSSSDIRRYGKTPEELRTDIQSNSYAKFVFTHAPQLDVCAVRWLYLETRNKIKVNTKEVPIILTRAEVESRWSEAEKQIREMIQLSEVEDSLGVPCNTDACGDFGGCEHLSRCGLASLGNAFKSKKQTTTEEQNTMGFLSKIKKQVDAEPEVESAKEETEETVGILPPDSPPRTTSDEDAEELTPKSKKKKAPKKEPKDEPEEKPKKPRGRPKGSKAKSKTQSPPRFSLFVDCMPIKGGDPKVNFEDWIAPIIATMNEECEAATGKPNFWLLPFGDQKAAIATAINVAVQKLNTNLVIMSSDPYARDVLPLLVPHATTVVRALRG